MEFYLKDGRPACSNSDKKEIIFGAGSVTVDGYLVDFPGEYEKSSVLVEASSMQGGLVFHLKSDGVKIAYLDLEKFEAAPELVKFFGDVDVFILPGSKEVAKAAEGVDARVVVPFGPGAQPFLAALGQSLEAAPKYKLKDSDLSGETTKFVSLA